MKIFILTAFIFLITTINLFAQNNFIKYELRCDCEKNNCDTITIKVYDNKNKLMCSFENDSLLKQTTYLYDDKGNLIRTINFNREGVFTNFVYKYYDENNNWIRESCFDAANRLIYVKSAEEDSAYKMQIIKCIFYNGESSFTERIVKDEFNNETAKTICYGTQNCITRKTNYINNKKVTTETWMFSRINPLPVLTETISYIYNEAGNLKMALVITGEEEKCKSIIIFP